MHTTKTLTTKTPNKVPDTTLKDQGRQRKINESALMFIICKALGQ